MTATAEMILDDDTRRVEDFLHHHGFPTAECYRPKGYNYLLRVRIIDDRFRGRSRVEREDLVEPLIQQLPEELQSAITMLVLISNDERKSSLVNREFEDPSHSQM